MAMVLTIEEMLQMAREKAASDSDLCRRAGISRATLWRIDKGKLKSKNRRETLGKLAGFILGAE